MAGHRKFDIIVVGSGIAGLSFALKTAEMGFRVAIITKKDSTESNTNYAQGGIAAVTSLTDEVDLHVEDTLEAGDGLCDRSAVEAILKDGPKGIDALVQKGVAFSQLNDGRISLGKEGGHSKRRILHVKDMTGKAIEEALLYSVAKNPLIESFEHHFAIELITLNKLKKNQHPSHEANRVLGLFALDVNSNRVETYEAKAVLSYRRYWSSVPIYYKSIDSNW